MGEGSFQGMSLSEENLHWGNLPELLYIYFFLYISVSLFHLNFVHGAVKGNCPG